MRTSEPARIQEIRVLFEQGGAVPWANLTIGGLLVWALWNDAPHLQLLGWLAAVVALNLLRLAFHRRFVRERPSDAEVGMWGRRFVAGSTCSGVLWGLAAVAFFSPESLVAEALLTFAIGGMIAAAAGTLACHLPAFYGFCACSLGPLALRVLTEGDRMHVGMGAMLLVYGVVMLRVARNNHQALAHAFGLSRENALLLERVSLSEHDLRDSNRTLEQRVQERTRELECQTHALQRAQRLEVAGRLAGGLAHDFNSLLTVITNNAAQLKDTQSLDEQGRVAAAETLQAGRRGVALIRHLLAVSRQKQAEPRVFQLNSLISEWSTLLGHILGEGFGIRLDLTEDPTLVYADPAQVEQVLVNLVAGSRSGLSSSGQLSLSTRIAPVPESAGLPAGTYVSLSVERTESDTKRSINPYLSLETDGRSSSMGLSTAVEIAQGWGGRVSIEHEDHSSVRFQVLLPAPAASLALLPLEREPTAAGPRDATILVVDDEPTLRSVIRRCLTREGYTVLVAEDGEQAFELAAREEASIDLLITDVVMPGLTGLELAEKLKPLRPDMAVLFISGFTFDAAMPPADTARGTAYLPKPFDTKALTTKVQELLLASRAEDGVARGLGAVSRLA
jgi:CheY-like chemotaxis protein/nitrogen-specific signal transduction histidine kinase